MLLFRPSLLLTISYQHWHSTTGATLGAASGTANGLGLLSTSSLDVLTASGCVELTSSHELS